jgi:hypothetical protein
MPSRLRESQLFLPLSSPKIPGKTRSVVKTSGESVSPARRSNPPWIDPMKAFLLPCACSQSIVITSGQAGGTVSCPGCGREVAVPKLRDFGRLEAAATGQSRRREGWRASHACMLAGGLTAFFAWAVAVVFAMPTQSPFTADAIRAGVAAASDRQIYEAWKSLSRSGISRPPLPDEKRIQQTASFRSGLSRGLFVIGGLGAAVGLLGVALRAGGERAEA